MSEKVPSQVGSQVIMHATQTTLEMENNDGNVRFTHINSAHSSASDDVALLAHIFRIHMQFFTDTFMSSESWAAALYAAGSVIEAVDLVMGKSHRNAVCAVRPPGSSPLTPLSHGASIPPPTGLTLTRSFVSQYRAPLRPKWTHWRR
jgi:hypothetical protein